MTSVTYDPASQLNLVDQKTGQNLTYNGGDMAWTLTSAVLVWIMTPGVGFLYSGMVQRRNALSMLHLSLGTVMVVTFQWFLLGYSLVFSDTGSRVIGDLRYWFLNGVAANPSMLGPMVPVPAIIFCVFELGFAVIAPMLALGAIAGRGRLGPAFIFVFIWTTLVYDPIAYWTWNPKGWAKVLGVLDFAGGTPVHVACGSAALAISVFFGRSPGFGANPANIHSMSHVVLGTTLMWFGWFGFTAGSTLSSNMRTAQALIVTTLSGGFGGATWMLLEYYVDQRLSTYFFCCGVLSGLVAITPASGFVPVWAAMIFGVTASLFCSRASHFLRRLRLDDVHEVFATHAIGGLTGNFLTAIFAQKSVAAMDGRTVISGGWLDGNFIQLAHQIAISVAGIVYSSVLTYAILEVMSLHPLTDLRFSSDMDVPGIGVDELEIGEHAYDYDEFQSRIPPAHVLA